MSAVTKMLVLWRRRAFVVRRLEWPARRWALKRYLEDHDARAERVRQASLGSEGRLVFICHGNIMRSAYAAQVARQRFPQWASRVVDGGTHAKLGRPAQDSAVRVGRELHAPLDGHTATPLAALALSSHDVVVCMDAMNEANVLAAYPALERRVFRVGDILGVHPALAVGMSAPALGPMDDREVRDPYGKGDKCALDAFTRLTDVTVMWMVHVGAS